LTLPIEYDGREFDEGYRIDELVDGLVIVENKAVDDVHPIHMAQLLTYMKLKNVKLGFLINWNVKLIKNGVHRVVNGLEESPYRAGFIRKPKFLTAKDAKIATKTNGNLGNLRALSGSQKETRRASRTSRFKT